MAKNTSGVRNSHTAQLHLTRHRESKGIPLQEIAESTKISTRFLKAIEAEEFGKLPGGIFNTSYIRQYAAAVGFDESVLLARYRLCMGLPESQDQQQGRKRQERSSSRKRFAPLDWLPFSTVL